MKRFSIAFCIFGLAGGIFFFSDPYDWMQVLSGLILFLGPIASSVWVMWKWGWVLLPEQDQIWARGRRWNRSEIEGVACGPSDEEDGPQGRDGWTVGLVLRDGTLQQHFNHEKDARRTAEVICREMAVRRLTWEL